MAGPGIHSSTTQCSWRNWIGFWLLLQPEQRRSRASLQDMLWSESPPEKGAANLRRAFSGIVSGNVREDTAELIEREGPFEIDGSRRIMGLLDDMLGAFVAQQRMKISTGDYDPCYVIK